MCAKSGTQILFDLRLNTESETHSIRVVRVAAGDTAVGKHIQEGASVSRIRRTQPPVSRTC